MPLICDGDMNQRVRRSSGEPVGAKPDWTELKPGGREGGLPGVSVLPAQPRKGKSICQPPLGALHGTFYPHKRASHAIGGGGIVRGEEKIHLSWLFGLQIV